MNRRLRNSVVAIILCVSLIPFTAGCNATDYQKAKNAMAIINAIFVIAKTDLPALETTKIIPLSAQPIVSAFLDLGISAVASGNTCIEAGQATPKAASVFLACYMAFSNQLKNSSQLAALKVLPSTSMGQVELWIAVLDTTVTTIAIALGGTAPVISAPATSTTTLRSSAVIVDVKKTPAYKDFEKRVKAYAKAHQA
jgi:hypothetical protein